MPFSAREHTVLLLMADAASKRQIAARLVLADSTVEWHVSNLLAQLGVRSRLAAGTRA